MKIDYTDDAIEDLKQLREFIAAKNPAAVGRYASAFINGMSQLKNQPQLGYTVSDVPEPESIRDLIVSDYIVRYALLENQIIILRIWHHKENWK